ncbi:unnamed protein product [Lathyrus oleraceus]
MSTNTEAGLEEVVRVVQPDDVDSVSSITANTKVTTPSTEPSVHTVEDSLENPLIGQCLPSMLTMWRYKYGSERSVPH